VARIPKYEPEMRRAFLHIIDVLMDEEASPLQKRLGAILADACDGRDNLQDAMQEAMNELVKVIYVVKSEIKGIHGVGM
jgi:hypothetical protein